MAAIRAQASARRRSKWRSPRTGKISGCAGDRPEALGMRASSSLLTRKNPQSTVAANSAIRRPACSPWPAASMLPIRSPNVAALSAAPARSKLWRARGRLRQRASNPPRPPQPERQIHGKEPGPARQAREFALAMVGPAAAATADDNGIDANAASQHAIRIDGANQGRVHAHDTGRSKALHDPRHRKQSQANRKARRRGTQA